MIKSKMISRHMNYPITWPDRFLPLDQKVVLILVAAYRGFALAFALALIFLNSQGELRLWSNGLIVLTVSIYTVLRVIRPLTKRNSAATYFGFSLDLTLALGLPIFTGGLYSPFLLYALSPILTSAVLFRRRTTMLLACLPALSAGAGYAIAVTTANVAVKNPLVFTLGFLAIYAASSFLLSWLLYVVKNVYEETKVRAVRDERKRLSRDIHDGMAQTVGIISWKLDLLQQKLTATRMSKILAEVEEIGRLVTYLKGEAKDVINELRLQVPNDGGFGSSLSQYAADFTEKYGTKCEVSVAGEEAELPETVVTELLCVVREALSNIRKHGFASKVEISLRFRGGLIELRVRDDGCGFDQEKESTGYGLAVMSERVKSVGGEIFVISKPGWGTEICVYLFTDAEGRKRGIPSPYERLEV